jgi:hypothetical protein
MRHWIRLNTNILDDPKMGRLPDRLWRRAIELLLLAGQADQDGLLPEVTIAAWALRIEVSELEEQLAKLEGVGIVRRTQHGWMISDFTETQGPGSRSCAGQSIERWRREVFERDDYTCQECGARSADVYAHHIRPWYLFPEERFDIENGITLCADCHRKRHKRGWKKQAEKEFRATQGNR